MPDYNINIQVHGRDNASGALRNVSGALGGISTVAGGILTAGLFTGILQGIQGLATQAIMATANMEKMQVGMEGLIAKEISQQSAAQAAADALQGIETKTLKIADAMPLAQEKAKGLMDELAEIAILSPYQTQVIQSTFQTAMAFGYTTDEAKSYTKALLNVAAGVGAGNEQMGRMAYNLAQIRMVGKVTAVDLRQLSMAGFDLTSVLKYTGDEMGVHIETYEDFNKAIAEGKITWEDFTTSFAKYSEENFGGAAERMARTFTGLQSTFSDLFTLTFPAILGKGLSVFVGFANRILNAFLKLRESGILEKLGDSVGVMAEKAVAWLEPLASMVEIFFEEIGAGRDPIYALKIMLAKTFNFEVVQAVADIIEGIAWLKTAFTQLWVSIQPVLLMVWQFITQNVSLKDVFITLGIIIASVVLPALLSLMGTILAAAAPILLLLAAVVIMRQAWENNWLGIRDTLTAVWIAIQPHLEALWAWLQQNLPVAIQTLTDFWNNTLKPALETFWAWVQSTVFPALQTLWDWLQTNIPAAIATLKTFWETDLKPAFEDLVSLYESSIKPVLEALRDVLIAVGEKGFEFLAALWENKLKPAFEEIGTWLTDNMSKAWTDFKTWLDEAAGGVNGVQSALEGAKKWLDNLAKAIANLKLPGWLTPGSPTPFEMGLRGINKAMQQLSQDALPVFSAAIGFSGQGQTPAYATAGAPVNVTVNASVSSDLDVRRLASVIADEIQRRQS